MTDGVKMLFFRLHSQTSLLKGKVNLQDFLQVFQGIGKMEDNELNLLNLSELNLICIILLEHSYKTNKFQSVQILG